MPDSLVLQWRAQRLLQDLWPPGMLTGTGTNADPYELNDAAIKAARDVGKMPSTSHRMQKMAELLGANAGGVRGMAPLLALRARAGKPGRLVAFVDYFQENMVLVKTSCDQWTDENKRDCGIGSFEADGNFMTGLFFNALDSHQQNVVMRGVKGVDAKLRFGRGKQTVHEMISKLRRDGLLPKMGSVAGVRGRSGRTGGVNAVVPPPGAAPVPAAVPTVMPAGMGDLFKGQIADLRAQNKDLIAERGAAAVRHKAEMTALRNEYDRYKADNSNTGRRNEIANSALAAAKTTARAAESALAEERLRVQQLERDLAAARVRIGGLQVAGGQVGGRGGSQFQMRPGDWTCPTCRSHNFASKLVCYRGCGTARPARPAVNVVAEGAAAVPPGMGVVDPARYARLLGGGGGS